MRIAFRTIFKSIRISNLFYVLMLTLTTSCGFVNMFKPAAEEEAFFVSRKYIGVFIDFRQTGPDDLAGPNILWIKTSMEDEFGKISAYGKKCDFTPGDRLFIRRTLYDPGISMGYWEFYIENDSAVSYKATEFQHDHKIYTETFFK